MWTVLAYADAGILLWAVALVIGCGARLFSPHQPLLVLRSNVVEFRACILALGLSFFASSFLCIESLSRVIKPSVVELLIYVLPTVLCGCAFCIRHQKPRALLEGLAAIYLGVQLFIGMSGFGAYFFPSAVCMAVACTSNFAKRPV